MCVYNEIIILRLFALIKGNIPLVSTLTAPNVYWNSWLFSEHIEINIDVEPK